MNLNKNILVLVVLPILSVSCVTQPKTRTNAAGIVVTYPDADTEKRVPEFCNPTGKKGEALEKCLAYNETLYQSFDDEAKVREPWFNFAPDNWLSSQELDEKYILSVKPEAESGAVGQLQQAAFVPLSTQDIETLTGAKREVPDTKPYLVRSLYYVRDTGEFSVFEKDGSILVRHDSLGPTNTKESRTAVILFLKQPPKNVYVDCQISE